MGSSPFPFLRFQEDLKVFNLLIELTTLCNLKCLHCFLHPFTKERKFISPSRLVSFVKELKDYGLTFITFTGGEPFLHPEFRNILREISNMEFALRIYTNLTLLTDDFIQEICSWRIWEVETSLYGARPETHDRITGSPGSFWKIIQNASKLVRKGIKVNLKMLLLRMNYKEYMEAQKIALNEGFGFIASEVLLPCEGEKILGRFQMNFQELLDFYTSFPLFPLLRRRKKIFPLCNIRFSLYISSEGTVRRCMECSQRCGNIFKNGVSQILNSREFNYSPLIASSFPSDKCRYCEDVEFCHPCPALIRDKERGKIMLERFCTVARARKSAVLKLKL